MKTFLIATVLTIGLATQVLAAPTSDTSPSANASSSSSTYFAVRDTVGNCAVVDTHPSKRSGLRVLGDKGGYPSEADAQKSLGAGCSSVIDRS